MLNYQQLMLNGKKYMMAINGLEMKEILVGWCEEDQRIHVCFEVESMEVMEKFTQKHAEVIASSGHKQETTVVKILSDS